MDGRKCNLGCGADVREGWVNVDRMPLPGVNVLADLSHFPYPFKDSVFDSLEARHVLEHIPDVVKAFEEFHRISRANAMMYVEVPFWNSEDAHTDPTHLHFFSHRSFDYFSEGGTRSNFNYYSKARVKIVKVDYKLNTSPYVSWIPRRLRLKLAKYVGNMVVSIGFHLRVEK